MRAVLGLMLLLGLAACEPGGPAGVRYRVLAHEAEVASATLTLCDRQTPMVRDGAVWQADVAASCEGGGHILVVMADGSSVSCTGDSVEPGQRGETFGYVVSPTGCAFSE